MWILGSVAVQLVYLLQQFLGSLLVDLNFCGEGGFEVEEREDVVLKEFCIIEEFFRPSDLFWFALLLKVTLRQLESRSSDVPILEDGDPGLFWFEELRHQSNQIVCE